MSNTDQAFGTTINKAAGFLDEIERLQAQAAAMRGALEATLDEMTACSVCSAPVIEKVEAALAADAGHELLERLRRAERERDEAQAALAAVHDLQLAILGRKG